MATSQTAALDSRKGKKWKRGKAHPKESNTKLTMKYIELDPENEFTISAGRDGHDHYTVGELYQVVKSPSETDGESFIFHGVKKVLAHFELRPDQYSVLQEVLKSTNKTIEEFMEHAIIGRIGADVDGMYLAGDPRRNKAFKALGERRL